MTQIKAIFAGDFAQMKTIAKYNNWNLILSTAIVVFTSYSECFKQFFPFDVVKLNEIFNAINIVFIFMYVLVDLMINSLLPKAESRRRLACLDNSFGKNFTGTKSENYYNSENLNFGLLKLAANCFESALFTFNISRKMLMPLIIKNLIIIAFFLLAAYLGERKILILLSQLTLPVILLQQLVKLNIYVNNNEQILTNFRELFTDLRDTTADRSPQMIRNILHYESNISWGSILLDDDYYKKLNPELSQEWEEYKILYKIG
jgi:hypothetical protein